MREQTPICEEHQFPEEETPEGVRLLFPCLHCGVPAGDALLALRTERNELDVRCSELDAKLSDAQQWLDSEPEWKAKYMAAHAALSARCTALTDINAGLVKDHNYLLIDGAKWQTRAETAEARCAALEQERNTITARCEALEQENRRLTMEENIVWYGPHACAVCGVEIVKAAAESGGMELEVPERLMRVYRMGSESNDPDVVYPMVWKPHVHA